MKKKTICFLIAMWLMLANGTIVDASDSFAFDSRGPTGGLNVNGEAIQLVDKLNGKHDAM